MTEHLDSCDPRWRCVCAQLRRLHGPKGYPETTMRVSRAGRASRQPYDARDEQALQAMRDDWEATTDLGEMK